MRAIFPALALTLGVLAGCANPTPFQAADSSGNGYTVDRLEQNRYRVSFAGNSVTDRGTVDTYLMYLASQVTLKNGFDYFVVIARQADKDVAYDTWWTGTGGFGRFGRRGFFGTGFDTSYTRPINSYNKTAEVQLFRGQRPLNNPLAYDAREVANSIGPRVVPGVGPF